MPAKGFCVERRNLHDGMVVEAVESAAGALRVAPNSFEKNFEPQLAAIWAVAASGQKDVATIDALVARLDATGDPLWLRAQIVGALTALTGGRFAYDIEKWRKWWRAARPEWQG